MRTSELYVTTSTLKERPDSTSSWNSEEIWREFKNGSELAFTAIYKKHIYDLYHYGERLTSNKQLIEDSIHDFFVDLWKQREGYGDVTNLKFYLLKGFKYRLFKNLQKLKKLPLAFSIDEEYDIEIVFSKEFEWISNQVSEEKKQWILKNINELTKREKEAITLRFYDGFSYEEIASAMSLTKKSTYKLIYRAIEVLKRSMSKL